MINKNIQGNDLGIWICAYHIYFLLIREVPHSTTVMSPFQLVYSHILPGPLKLLKEFWTGRREIILISSLSEEQYVNWLLEKLKNAQKIASENTDQKNKLIIILLVTISSVLGKNFWYWWASFFNLAVISQIAENMDQQLTTIIELTWPKSVFMKLDADCARKKSAYK